MLTIVITSLLPFIIVPILKLVDKKIKMKASITTKFFTMVLIGLITFSICYLYGDAIFEILGTNLKSFRSLKSFYFSRLIALILIILLFIILIINSLYLLIELRSNSPKNIKKLEKRISILTIVFDIAVIPNIVVFSNAAFLAVAASLICMGLAYYKLVFYFNKTSKGYVNYSLIG